MEKSVDADLRAPVSERRESNGPALSERSESKGCDNACPTCYSPDTCASRAVDLEALSPDPSSSSPVRP